MSLEVEVSLKVHSDNQPDDSEEPKSALNMFRNIVKQKVMNNVNDDEKYEPGSPTNFTFSTIGRLSKK